MPVRWKVKPPSVRVKSPAEMEVKLLKEKTEGLPKIMEPVTLSTQHAKLMDGGLVMLLLTQPK